MKKKILIKDILKKVNCIPCEQGIYYVKKPKNIKLTFNNKFLYHKNNNNKRTIKPKIITSAKKEMLKEDILYIGSSNDLRRRLVEYYCFLYCNGVRHVGGKTIGQINQLNKLYILFEAPKKNYKQAEKNKLDDFKKDHNGHLPFANIKSINKV